jgi:hypothetical protein
MKDEWYGPSLGKTGPAPSQPELPNDLGNWICLGCLGENEHTKDCLLYEKTNHEKQL